MSSLCSCTTKGTGRQKGHKYPRYARNKRGGAKVQGPSRRKIHEREQQKNSCQLPEITFSTFILSLASSTLVQLGEVPNPVSGVIEPNPELAKHAIDTLAMLEEKTRKGLDENEKQMLHSLLYELKMKYVCLCDKLNNA